MEEKEMEKDRSSRIIAIIALVIAVLGVSLGFATYAQNMTITQNATVKGVEGNFVVGFSTNDSDILPGSVTASGTGGATGENATLINTTVSNLNATFTNDLAEAQNVSYEFYVYNKGSLDAYLKKVTFSKQKPTCASVPDGNVARDDLVQAACENISIKITIGDHEYNATNTANPITDMELKVKKAVKVKVDLSYTNTTPVDGDFKVDFRNITLNYSSSNGN